jgi:hypothetical protein
MERHRLFEAASVIQRNCARIAIYKELRVSGFPPLLEVLSNGEVVQRVVFRGFSFTRSEYVFGRAEPGLPP